MENVLLPSAANIIQQDQFGGGSVMVWGGLGLPLEGCTDLYRIDNGNLNSVVFCCLLYILWYRDEILGPIVRHYAGAVGPGSFWCTTMPGHARPHVARECRQFLDD